METLNIYRIDLAKGTFQNCGFEFQGITTIDDLSSRLADGAYTTFRTYPGQKILRFHEHVERLQNTAQIAGHAPGFDLSSLRGIIGGMTEASGLDEVWRVRLHWPFEGSMEYLYCGMERMQPYPPECYTEGVRAITVKMARKQPKAKLSGFITAARKVRKTLPAGIHEAIMVAEDGEMLEGLSSNFYTVRAGILSTASSGVLEGITRGMVLKIAAESQLQIESTGTNILNIGEVEEAFITSSSRGVMPVVEIDGMPVGSGKPGTWTQCLMKGYEDWLERNLE